MALFSDNELIDGIVNAVFELQSKANTKLPLLQQRLTEVEKQIDNLMAAILQ